MVLIMTIDNGHILINLINVFLETKVGRVDDLLFMKLTLKSPSDKCININDAIFTLINEETLYGSLMKKAYGLTEGEKKLNHIREMYNQNSGIYTRKGDFPSNIHEIDRVLIYEMVSQVITEEFRRRFTKPSITLLTIQLIEQLTYPPASYTQSKIEMKKAQLEEKKRKKIQLKKEKQEKKAASIQRKLDRKEEKKIKI
jgi:hypothetical protein